MKTKMLVLATDNPEPMEFEVDLPEDPGFDRLLPHLKGAADMEHVTVLHEGERRDMFVDEMGAIKVPPLPRNESATVIYRNNWLTQHPRTPAEELPCIFGTAVFFPDRQVWL